MDYCVNAAWFLLLIVCINCATDDLYNSKAATSDLQWTVHPAQNGWEEISISYRDGTVIRSYQVCNYQNKDTSSWARTPFIKSRGAKRAYIDIEFSIRNCDDLENDCRETFNLYYFESNRDSASSTFPPWREDPYIKIDTIAAGEKFGSSDADRGKGVNFKTWTLGPLSRNGFYIAAQDQGACMSIMSLRVYYFYCDTIVRNLSVFPRTVSGNETISLDEVKGTCVRNAGLSPADDPKYYCNGNGEWKVFTGSCRCNPGFQPDRRRISCISCLAGYYKASTGNHQCTRCPTNSTNLAVLTDDVENGPPIHCPCIDGHYRSAQETVHYPCTVPPSKPVNLRYNVNSTSVALSWQEPVSNGGRNDTYYNVSCFECEQAKMVNVTDFCSVCPTDVAFVQGNQEYLHETTCFVTNLKPFTKYKFQIYAMNGVSRISSVYPASETVTILTKEGVPSSVDNVTVLENEPGHLTLSWSFPKSPNGRVINYEVTWVDGIKRSSVETVQNKISINDVLPGHTYTIKVRARTKVGYGQYGKPSVVLATSGDFGEARFSPVISNGAIYAIIAVVAFLSFFMAVIVYRCLKKRRWILSKQISNDGNSEEKVALNASAEIVVNLPPSANNVQRQYVDYIDPYRAVQEFSCEIVPSDLTLGKYIGEGEFGEVCRGKLIGKHGPVDVAVKTMKGGSKDQFNFLREASIMAQFSHPNVIQLKGVVTKTHPHMIITEYMENGSLDVFLQKKKNCFTVVQLVEMLKGIASGMKYLASMKYIHRDLAARNILVDSKLVCKVSDFGLSRTIENDPHATYTAQGGKIAIRWTAPECIRSRKFTSASDVWSYGILMWEMMSYGEKPYWEMENQDLLESIDQGFRLPPPQGCPVCLHRLMVQCWAYEAKTRPAIDDVHKRLGELLQRPNLLIQTSNKAINSNATTSVA